MVAENYMIVYLNSATSRRKMPGLDWVKKYYQMIDRQLCKNLKSFTIVHPSWFIRTFLPMTWPFISSKFSSKIKRVSSLSGLSGLIPIDCIHIPESTIKYDEEKSQKCEYWPEAERKALVGHGWRKRMLFALWFCWNIYLEETGLMFLFSSLYSLVPF
jgi:hypothetical protein